MATPSNLRPANPTKDNDESGVRIDKWLWAARFYKSRSLAAQAIAAGHVRMDGLSVRASRCVAVDDEITFRQGAIERTVKVMGISQVRGPAPIAQALYAETPGSVEERQKAAEARRLGVEPGLTRQEGRPTKRERRDWVRWSAQVDNEH